MSALHLAVHGSSRSKLDEECALETVKTLFSHHAQFAATNHQVIQGQHTFHECVGPLFNGKASPHELRIRLLNGIVVNGCED